MLNAAGEDQLRRAVAAENLLFFHPFKFRNGGNKLPAIGVRVVAQSIDAARHRVFHGLGGTVGIDIGGKIQQDLPGVQIPAVGILGFVEHGQFLEWMDLVCWVGKEGVGSIDN